MRIMRFYSHLNGWEFVKCHHPEVWSDVESVIDAVDAEKCRTKQSKEARRQGRMLLSPPALNAEYKREFEQRGWQGKTIVNWISDDLSQMRQIISLSGSEQKKKIIDSGRRPIMTSNQTDFVKDRCAVEIQFGKYSFVAHDLHVKHLTFFQSDEIDVGIEIVPMKEMEQQMSSGVAYFERDLFNLVRQGRASPAVPIILVGVMP